MTDERRDSERKLHDLLTHMTLLMRREVKGKHKFESDYDEDDAAQDYFLKMWKSKGVITPLGCRDRALHLRNTCIDRIRKQNRRGQGKKTLLAESEVEARDIGVSNHAYAEAQELLKCLDSEERVVLLLLYQGGSFDAIAACQGVTKQVARRKYHSIIEKLRRRLAARARGDDQSAAVMKKAHRAMLREMEEPELKPPATREPQPQSRSRNESDVMPVVEVARKKRAKTGPDDKPT